MKTILLAEDYDEDAKCFSMVLESAGVASQVIRVKDGLEAIAYLEGKPPYDDRTKFPFPDVVMIDLKMPRVDGFEVLEWVKKNVTNKLLPVVLSGHDEVNAIQHAYALGAATFLVKPCHPQDVRNLTKTYSDYFTLTPGATTTETEERETSF